MPNDIPMPVSADPTVPDPAGVTPPQSRTPVRARPTLGSIPGTPVIVLSPHGTPGRPTPVSVPIPASVLRALQLHQSFSSSKGLFTPQNESSDASASEYEEDKGLLQDNDGTEENVLQASDATDETAALSHLDDPDEVHGLGASVDISPSLQDPTGPSEKFSLPLDVPQNILTDDPPSPVEDDLELMYPSGSSKESSVLRESVKQSEQQALVEATNETSPPRELSSNDQSPEGHFLPIAPESVPFDVPNDTAPAGDAIIVDENTPVYDEHRSEITTQNTDPDKEKSVKPGIDPFTLMGNVVSGVVDVDGDVEEIQRQVFVPCRDTLFSWSRRQQSPSSHPHGVLRDKYEFSSLSLPF